VPTLPLLLFGVDWGTLPLSYRRSKKGKPRRAADLEFALTRLLDALGPSTSDTEGWWKAIGRRPGGPLV
jgi:hypothetical protein